MNELLAIVAAYAVGSIPFALLVSRRHGIDVRRVGSGNVGATNVLRTVGIGPGMLVMLLDIGKGVIAVLVAQRIAADAAVAAGLTAIAGHVWPVWLGFRGGKGVATGAGVFGVLMPIGLVVAAVMFVLTVAITRYMSLGSIVGAVTIVGAAVVTGARLEVTAAAAVAMMIVVFRHRANLRRLMSGTEPRLGQPPITGVSR